MGLIDGGASASRGRGGFGVFSFSIGSNGIFFNRNVFDSLVKS